MPIVKAVAIKQPRVTQLAAGEHSIEVKTWETAYRGEILLVSAMVPRIEPAGYAIAVADLVDCRAMTRDDEARAGRPRYQNAISWVFENVRPIKIFPVKVGMDLFDVNVPEAGIQPIPRVLVTPPVLASAGAATRAPSTTAVSGGAGGGVGAGAAASRSGGAPRTGHPLSIMDLTGRIVRELEVAKDALDVGASLFRGLSRRLPDLFPGAQLFGMATTTLDELRVTIHSMICGLARLVDLGPDELPSAGSIAGAAGAGAAAADGSRGLGGAAATAGGAAPPRLRLLASVDAPAPRRYDILVVDKHPLVARGIRRLLAEEHDVRLALSVEQALSEIARRSPDVVVCDHDIGCDESVTFLRRLSEEHANIRRVLYSASRPHTWQRLLDGRLVHSAVAKPTTRAKLLAAIAA